MSLNRFIRLAVFFAAGLFSVINNTNIFASQKENYSSDEKEDAVPYSEIESEENKDDEKEVTEDEKNKSFTEKESPLFHLYTFIDSPVAEKRQSMDRNEIALTHASDLPELLSSMGVQFLSYGSYGLEQKASIRGFTDETVRVVIDGVCVNNPQYGTFDFSSVNIMDIESISLVRGGFTEGVSDEGAVGGVLYINTKKEVLENEVLTDFSLSSFFNLNQIVDSWTQKVLVNLPLGENTFFKTSVSSSRSENAYFYTNWNGEKKTRENSGVKDFSFSNNFRHFFGKGNSFSISSSFYDGNKNTPGPLRSSSYGIQTDRNLSLTAGFVFPSLLKNVFELYNENYFTYSKNFRTYTDSSSFSSHDLSDFVFTSRFSKRWGNFKEDLGLTFSDFILESSDDGNHDILSFCLKETSSYSRGAFSFSLPLGIKFYGENFAFLPKAGFEIDFEKLKKSIPLKTSLSFYKSVQFPNMDDLYWKGSFYHGNPDLKAETGWGSDLTFSLEKYLPFSLTFYGIYYKDKIKWSCENGVWSPENLASAFYVGLDFSASWTFFKILNLSFSLEWQKNFLLTDPSSSTYMNTIMWTPDLVANLSISSSFKNLRLFLNAFYMGKRYEDNDNLYAMSPYFLLDLGADFTFWKKITPYIKLNNVFNCEYYSVPDYPMPGISIKAGFSTK